MLGVSRAADDDRGRGGGTSTSVVVRFTGEVSGGVSLVLDGEVGDFRASGEADGERLTLFGESWFG